VLLVVAEVLSTYGLMRFRHLWDPFRSGSGWPEARPLPNRS